MRDGKRSLTDSHLNSGFAKRDWNLIVPVTALHITVFYHAARHYTTLYFFILYFNSLYCISFFLCIFSHNFIPILSSLSVTAIIIITIITLTLRSGGLLMVPSLFESNILEGEMPYADLMTYPISPTHAMPHTYPMLDADPENIDDEMEGEPVNSALETSIRIPRP
jgi:hypothetical protein